MRNSKRCSTVDRFLLALATLLLGTGAFAASAPSAETFHREIDTFLRANRGGSFEPLLQRWQDDRGSSAVGALLHVASDLKHEDPERYVALMGAARLGGTQAAPLLTRFLKDRSWMIRNGALRALTALDHPQTRASVLPLLRDPALVVRVEAVEAVRALRPLGAEDALVAAALAPENFHAGKAQWVPQKALQALVDLDAAKSAPRLAPLLDKHTDPLFQRQVVQALVKLKGKSPTSGSAPLSEQIAGWKKELARGQPEAKR